MKVAQQLDDWRLLEAATIMVGRLMPSVLRSRIALNNATSVPLPLIEIALGNDKACTGDLDGAIAQLRSLVDDEFASGEMVFRSAAVASLVESLLQRSAEGDMAEAESATERLAEGPTVPGFALYDVELLRMRALLARARGDEPGHRELVERYRTMAASRGFRGTCGDGRSNGLSLNPWIGDFVPLRGWFLHDWGGSEWCGHE